MNNIFIGVIIGILISALVYVSFKPATNRDINVVVSDTSYVPYGVEVVKNPLVVKFIPDTSDRGKLREAYRLIDSLKNQFNGDYGSGYGGYYIASIDTSIINGDTLIYVSSDMRQSIPFSQDLSGKLTIKYNLPTINNTQTLIPEISFWEKFIDRFGFYLGAGVGYDTEGKLLPNINVSFGFKL